MQTFIMTDLIIIVCIVMFGTAFSWIILYLDAKTIEAIYTTKLPKDDPVFREVKKESQK